MKWPLDRMPDIYIKMTLLALGDTSVNHLFKVEFGDRSWTASHKSKPDECLMLQEDVTFRGHVVSREDVKLSQTNLN